MVTKGWRDTAGLRSRCHEIPSRRGGGSGRMGITATFGSFSSTVRSGRPSKASLAQVLPTPY